MKRANRVLFKDLSDESLVENYIAVKMLAYNAARVKSRGLGRLLRDLDIIVAVARKRGLRLPVA
jgi:hypothetical protein